MAIAVIGGGMAGAACARRLASHGLAVTVFDKGRGPGGRMATRRADTPVGPVTFDHGAQFATARTPGFQARVLEWARDGAAARWSAAEHGGEPAWIGYPGMNAMVRAALDGLDARFQSRVEAVGGGPGAWTLTMAEGPDEGPYAQIVSAIPAEQAGPLLEPAAPVLAAEARAARTAPCWSLMALFDGRLDVGPALRPDTSPAMAREGLSWAALTRSRPGRHDVEGWVIHADQAWSRANLELEPDVAAARLVAAFRAVSGAPEPLWAQAHRWRYALVTEPAGTPFGWDAGLGVGACGDWRLGPRVELAWVSGDSLGAAMLAAVSGGEAADAPHPAPS